MEDHDVDDVLQYQLRSLAVKQYLLPLFTLFRPLCPAFSFADVDESAPKDLKESIFIPIPKEPKATRCQEYRSISIMSQVTKQLLKIVIDRMKRKREAELDDAQSGFREGKRAREGLLNLRLIM